MTSRTTWKNRGIRAAVALAAVGALALWLLALYAVTVLAKLFLTSPWSEIAVWAFIALAAFVAFYTGKGPKRRSANDGGGVEVRSRAPRRSDLRWRGTVWLVRQPGSLFADRSFMQIGTVLRPVWAPLDIADHR